eukprot:SAG31_NODE_35534_length_322_cov_0.695067_1_plen_91_part_10
MIEPVEPVKVARNDATKADLGVAVASASKLDYTWTEDEVSITVKLIVPYGTVQQQCTVGVSGTPGKPYSLRVVVATPGSRHKKFLSLAGVL